MTDNRPAAGKAAYAYLVAATSIWGSLYVVAKIVLATVPPFTVLFFRYLVAFAALLSLVKLRKGTRRAPLLPRAGDYRYLFIVGVLGYALSIGFQLVGTKLAGASTASLINSMNPVFITVFALFILGERFTARKGIAVAAAVSGAALILGGAKEGGSAAGIAFSAGSVTLWSFSSVFVRRITAKYDPIIVTLWGVAVALVFAFPTALVELALVPHGPVLAPANIAAFLYLGVVCTAVSHALWNKSLSMLEASTCSLFYPIQPLVSVSLGVLLFSERIDAAFAVGAALIVGGILFAVTADRRRRTS